MFFTKKELSNIEKIIDKKLSNKKTEQICIEKGDFSALPNELMSIIIFYLDASALNSFAKTNSSFLNMVYDSKHIFFVVLNNNIKMSGTFAEMHTKYNDYLTAVSTHEANEKKMRDARDQEITKIKELKQSVVEIREDLKSWDIPRTNPTPFTKAEKGFTGLCCVIGTLGGSFVASFATNLPCAVGGLIGAIAFGCAPITLSRTTKCICGICYECKTSELESRVNNLDSDYPTPKTMTL